MQQLIEAMQQELQYQQNLMVLLENKLDAMRHYDISRMQALSLNEQRLIDGMRLNEKRRTEVVLRATRQFFPTRQGKPPTCRELAQAAPEPERSKLLALTGMLREVVEKVQRLHRVYTIATQKVMGHFNQIFRIIAQSGRDIGLYGRCGKKSLLEQNRLVDALA
jgi:flagellar biosynthesis/type III secretory pathway chaperone